MAGQIAGHEVDRIRQVLPSAGHAAHVGLPAELAVRADFARHPRDFAGEGVQLVHHGVDGVLELENFAFDIDGDFLGEVAGGDGLGHVGNVAHLRSQIAGHEVDRVGQVFPSAGHAFDVGLAAELAVGAHLARHASHFTGKRPKLVHHRIDGVLELLKFAADIHGDFLGQVAGRDGHGHFGDVADLVGEIAGHAVDGVGEVLPGAGDAFDVRLAAELAFGAHLAGHARHLRGKRAELVHHLIDDLRGPKELPLQWAVVHLQRHGLGEVSLSDGADDAGGFARWVDQIVNESIDRRDGFLPGAGHVAEKSALVQFAFLAHDPADVAQLFIERVGHLALHAGPFHRQPDREVPLFQRGEGLEQAIRIDVLNRDWFSKKGHGYFSFEGWIDFSSLRWIELI